MPMHIFAPDGELMATILRRGNGRPSSPVRYLVYASCRGAREGIESVEYPTRDAAVRAVVSAMTHLRPEPAQ